LHSFSFPDWEGGEHNPPDGGGNEWGIASAGADCSFQKLLNTEFQNRGDRRENTGERREIKGGLRFLGFIGKPRKARNLADPVNPA